MSPLPNTRTAPHQPSIDALLARAQAAHQGGDGAAAQRLCRAALALDPYSAPAYRLLAFAHARMGEFEPAIACYDQLLQWQPADGALLSDRGLALIQLGRQVEALADYDRAVALLPDAAPIHMNRANLLRSMGRYEDALAGYEAAIALNPDIAAFYYQRSNVLKALGRFEAAVASYAEALARKPDHADAHMHRALVLNRLTRFAEAHEHCESALALRPQHPETLNNMGLALRGLRRHAEALACFDAALAAQPDYLEALGNRGVALIALGRFADAEVDYDRMLTLTPHAAEVYSNRGLARIGLQDFPGALRDHDQALALRPDYDQVRASKAIIHLMLGNYAEGWAMFEHRWSIPGRVRRTLPTPLWLGDADISGKTILVYPEQGLGDFIMCARYVPMLEAMGATVLLETPPPLAALMASLSPSVRIVPPDAAVSAHDYHCPVMSLPLAFHTRVASIPATVPYLNVPAESQARWADTLGTKTRPRIGIVWSGSVGHAHDYLRSIAFASLAPLLALPYEFHCLQQEIRPEEIEAARGVPNLHLHTQALRDFTETGALVMAMDHVISVDTSVAHLAGALAKPLSVLLQYTPDYRWLMAREDSPWYPTAHLYRQPKSSDWEPVIAHLCRSLETQIAAR